MELILNQKFYNEKGENLKDGATMGVFLSSIISQSQGNNDIRKFWNWATILGSNEVLNIDKPDFDKLFTFVENSQHPNMIFLTKGQLLETLIFQRDNQSKVKELIKKQELSNESK